MANIIIIGPAHPLRGGIANFNHRLAEQFISEGHTCEIFSFSLQYPGFLFPGKTQYSDAAAPKDLKIHSVINSVNPLNWVDIGNEIKNKKPDIVVVRYWLPFMGPALGTILRKIKKNKYSRIVCIADNILPHESRPGDKLFTNYFLKPLDGVITMSKKVEDDLKKFDAHKLHRLIAHPLYDNFGKKISKEEARPHLGFSNTDRLLLFFGFIRKYKGLDLLLKAMTDPEIKKQNIKLIIAGEFYDEEKPYIDFIADHDLDKNVIVQSDFIPDDDVKYYFGAADVVVQPYRQATQSGVTPLAYHFEKPMIVTRVGGLPDMLSDGISGLIAEPDSESIKEKILQFFHQDENHFSNGILQEKTKYTWDKLTNAIFELADSVSV